MLRLRSVNVKVRDPMTGERHHILRDITLSVSPGEAVALIGPNGAGKSTLILAIAGGLSLVTGTIQIDDLDIKPGRAFRRRLRELVGVALQFPERGFYARNVREEIGFTCARLGWSPDQQEEAVADALIHVGLSQDYLNRSPHELSGGEKRLVALASALAHRPKLLLLDEPEVGLDRRGVERIGGIIRDFTGAGGAALVVTHDLEGALAWARRLLLLREGRVVSDMHLGDLCSQENWEEVSPWLWDQAAFGILQSLLKARGVNLPSPYKAPIEFYHGVKKRMERRLP